MILKSTENDGNLYNFDPTTNVLTLISEEGEVVVPDGEYDLGVILNIKAGVATNTSPVPAETAVQEDVAEGEPTDVATQATDKTAKSTKPAKADTTTALSEQTVVREDSTDALSKQIKALEAKMEAMSETFSKQIKEKEEEIVKLSEEIGKQPSVEPTNLNKELKPITETQRVEDLRKQEILNLFKKS